MNLLAYYAYGANPLLVVLLIILLVGALPWYPYNRTWNYTPVGAILLIVVIFLLLGCATTKTTWQEKLAPDALANKAVVAAAEHYGGQKAADLASAGLSATASVLQGYVDKKPPLDIIVESPGVEGVGHILVDYLKDKGAVKQSTIDNLHKAATFASKLTWTAK